MAASSADLDLLVGIVEAAAVEEFKMTREGGGGGGEGQQRETISCPSSPTETDCSSGFSTLRRRSVTLTEKVTGRAHWHTCFISSHTCFVVVFT